MHKCPTCNQEIKQDLTAKKSDKDHYLEFWIPTLGEKEALASWEEKQKGIRIAAPAVMSDIAGYVSQIDGSWIDSRSKHRTHLKDHNMIEVGNDVPMEQKKLDTRKDKERKEFIGRMVYEKLR